MKYINCCIVDCTEERVAGFTSDELLKIYNEDSLTDGVTPLISPSCDYTQDNEYVSANCMANNKRKQHSDENFCTMDSLSGPLATTYDESDDIPASSEWSREPRASKLPKFKVRKSVENTIESDVVRNILTTRDGRIKRNSNPSEKIVTPEAESDDRITSKKSGLQARRDWWKGV